MNYYDQTAPVRPGFIRADGHVDIAVYDDAAFIEHSKSDRYLEAELNRHPNDPRFREALFYSCMVENSCMAILWNEFVAKRKLLAALDRAESFIEGFGDDESQEPMSVPYLLSEIRAAIAYAGGKPAEVVPVDPALLLNAPKKASTLLDKFEGECSDEGEAVEVIRKAIKTAEGES